MKKLEELQKDGLREHLIEAISFTGYATRNLKNLEGAAKKLGVLPELILEARMLAEHRKKIQLENLLRSGRDMKRRQKQFQSYPFTIDFPLGANELWEQHCGNRKIEDTTLVLSIIHAYLLGSYEPPVTTRHWVIFGEAYPRSRALGHVRIRVNLSQGMKMALTQRAKDVGYKPTDIVRVLIAQTIEGKFCRPGTFEIVKRARVFNDPRAYVELSRDPRGVGAAVPAPRASISAAYEQSSPLSRSKP